MRELSQIDQELKQVRRDLDRAGKLDAMLAQEKLRASGDAIYHVLADTIVILKTAYREAGAERPVRQVREEAMDLMLQTVSGDNQEVSREFFCGQIRHLTERYHSLPEDYDKILDQIIEKRKKDKASMKGGDCNGGSLSRVSGFSRTE